MGIFDIFHKKEHIYNPNNIERFVDAQDKDYSVVKTFKVGATSLFCSIPTTYSLKGCYSHQSVFM